MPSVESSENTSAENFSNESVEITKQDKSNAREREGRSDSSFESLINQLDDESVENEKSKQKDRKGRADLTVESLINDDDKKSSSEERKGRAGSGESFNPGRTGGSGFNPGQSSGGSGFNPGRNQFQSIV